MWNNGAKKVRISSPYILHSSHLLTAFWLPNQLLHSTDKSKDCESAGFEPMTSRSKLSPCKSFCKYSDTWSENWYTFSGLTPWNYVNLTHILIIYHAYRVSRYNTTKFITVSDKVPMCRNTYKWVSKGVSFRPTK